MTESELAQLIGTFLVFVPCAAVIVLAAWWNIRKSKQAVQAAMTRIDQRTAEAMAHMTASVPKETLALTLTLHLRQGVNPAQAVADGVALADALSQYEQTLGGKGLTVVHTPQSSEPHTGRRVLAPVRLVGGRRRLERVAATGRVRRPMCPSGSAVVPEALAGGTRTQFAAPRRGS
jgi:hypothetical protein